MRPSTELARESAEQAAGEAHTGKAALKARLLAVAKHRFARFGFDGTSIHDIARDADVSGVEVLVHFGDKAGMLDAILEEGWKKLNSRLTGLLRQAITAREALLSMLAIMVNSTQEDEDFARLLLFEGRRPDPDSTELRLTQGYRECMGTCADIVRRGQREGDFKQTLHAQVMASMLIGAAEGIMRDRFLEEQRSSITPYTGIYLMSAFDVLITSLELR